MSRTAAVLVETLRPLKRRAALAGTTVLLGALLGWIGIFAWFMRLGLAESPWWVLVAWGTTAGLAGTVGWALWRRFALLTPAGLADQLEDGGFRRGSLRGFLEASQHGTSEALHAVADAGQAELVRTRGPSLLAPVAARLRTRTVLGGLILAIGAGLLGLATAGGRVPSLLWRPAMAVSILRAPVGLSLDRRKVEPGGSVSARINVPGRRRAILWSRAPGETWSGRGITLDSTGSASAEVGPIRNDLFLRVTSADRSSDTLVVHVRVPTLVAELKLLAKYPRYLGLDDEPLGTQGDTVVVPGGTGIEVRGAATAPLSGATWTAGSVTAAMVVEGGNFSGVLQPRHSNTWTLSLATTDSSPFGGEPIRVPIIVVRDSVPTVDLPVPGADTALTAMPRVPLVISAEDDHGLTVMILEAWRVTHLGEAGPVRRDNLQLPPDRDRQVVIPLEVSLEDRGLVPGDTLRLRVRVRDNSPEGQEGVSREYAFRLATRAELREATQRSGDALQERLNELGAETRQLERRTEDLATEQVRRDGAQGANSGEQLSYQDARRAEAVAESQAELMREAEEIGEAVSELQASAQAAGLDDPEFQRRLEEVRDQLARALTPELRERLAELQQALAQLDGERTRKALEEMAEAQQRLREALDRSRELFERAALEGDLAALEEEVRDLAAEERTWSEGVLRRDSATAAQEESELAARADSAAAALEHAAEAAGRDQPEQGAAMEEMATALRDAARQMEQAGEMAGEGKREAARRQGRRTAEQLEPLAEQMAGQRESLQQAWRQEVMDALDRVLADATRLADRQLTIAEGLKTEGGTPQLRAEQGAVEEGVGRLLEQMQEVSGKNALVPAQPSVALAAGRDAMRDVREALSSAGANSRDAARRASEAVDALNSAALGLVRARASVDGSASGSGLGEALEQLAQMAQQQGQLGQQAGGLLPMAGRGGQVQEQIRALGRRQREQAERLERMRAGGQVPGAAEMAGESLELARTLEAGRLDRQTVERQERLFRRMLDAGRTLQGEEEDQRQERLSETARTAEVKLPERSGVGAPDGTVLRMPSWEQLRNLSPDERRRVLEYFRRLGPDLSGREPGS